VLVWLRKHNEFVVSYDVSELSLCMFQLIALILGHIWHSGLVIFVLFSVLPRFVVHSWISILKSSSFLWHVTDFQEFPDESKSRNAS